MTAVAKFQFLPASIYNTRHPTALKIFNQNIPTFHYWQILKELKKQVHITALVVVLEESTDESEITFKHSKWLGIHPNVITLLSHSTVRRLSIHLCCTGEPYARTFGTVERPMPGKILVTYIY